MNFFIIAVLHTTALTKTADCGNKPLTYSTKRIVGGEEAVAGEWPWMVALFHSQGNHEAPYFKCGATLISEKWVATAAHCTLVLPQIFSVRLGEHDLNVKDNYEQDISVKNVVIHPSFGIGAKNLSTGKIGLYAEHDISLLELSKPAYFNERVSPVCVDSGFPDFAEGKDCYISGWGNKKLHTATEPKLLHVSVPLVSKETCNKEKSYGGVITDNMVCAGFEQGGKDTCEGDSGGPLLCEKDNKWYLHGISSFGHDACAIAYKYGVYTRVSQFKKWIKDVTGIDC
ncbi:trypsin-like isoform X2 [Xenia sp. Carnegie-2017]|uniref:trypsin-like isoform X2 n=1 Tax=Xenia sp. Carnegie-2017 TaxID=2897299 RepID=UPI001F034F95|nr:trypsin-like isoform X2 [Xenia sp. Carnegie-2017]